MRKALNENPVVQVVLVGVLIVIVAVLFMTRIAGQGNDASEPATDAATAEPTATVSPSAPAESEAPAAPSARTAPAPSGGRFEAGPGLPKAVAGAWESGDTVVLLVLKAGGIDDAKIARSIGAAKGAAGTSLFVVDAKRVADYSRIAGGVDLDRAPALVVVEPKRVTGDSLPAASVSYGFRGPQSIAQAVRDANYDGRENLPYYPQ